MKRVKFFITFLWMAGVAPAMGQNKEALAKVKAEVVRLSDCPEVKGGMVGFSLRSPDGTVLSSLQGDKSLVPASNLKLITTATALKVLGPDFRFETGLFYSGAVKNGVLQGDIIIRGGGDPSLGSERIPGNLPVKELMETWTAKIKEAGIKKIEGTILQDYSIFDKNCTPDGWIWGDIGNYYGAGPWGLNINENLYRLYFKPGAKEGDTTSVLRAEPAIPGLQFENKVLTGPAGSGDNAYIYGAPYSGYRTVTGTIPAGVPEFMIKGSMPDAPYLCAYYLYQTLSQSGVGVAGAPQPSDKLRAPLCEGKPVLIHTHYSPLLKDLVAYTNMYSINLYAESICRMIAVKQGLPGDLKNSSQYLESYWQGKGVNNSFVFLYDGSGLSPQNGITPSFMTGVLYRMAADSLFPSFFSSLAVAGESGTFSRFCKGTKAEKKVFGKSGSLSKVIGYSGYVKGREGKLYSFCILVNNFTGRSSPVTKKIEQILSYATEL